MKITLFIVLTPLHVYITKILIKYLDIVDYKILTTNKYINYFNTKDSMIFDIAELQESRIKKLLKLLKLKFTIKQQRFNKVFIPSDANPYIQVVLKKIIFDELNYFEEGGTLLYRIKENVSNKPQIKKSFVKKMLGINDIDNVLKDTRIQNAYVFFPKLLKTFTKNINLIDLSPIINNTIIEEVNIDEKYFNPDILIFTQPLTEDGYCKNYDEIKVIEEFIKNNQDKNIIIKLHPRDKIKSYDYLKKYDIIFMPDIYQTIPYQIMHARINPVIIVSFFSSILFSVPSIRKDFKRISLINYIDNQDVQNVVREIEKVLIDLERI